VHEAEEMASHPFEKNGAEQILKFPVHVGDCVGGDAERTDRSYCWSVEREITEKRGRGWEIINRTRPDHVILRFVPGVGITRYVFEHHGTVASADARLVAISPDNR
jgi:hypothetical protein